MGVQKDGFEVVSSFAWNMLARNKWQRLQGFLFIFDPVNDLHIILMQIFRVVYGDFVQNLISKIGKLPAFLAEGGNSAIAFPLVCHWLVTAQHFQGTPRKIRPSNNCSEPAIFLQLSKVKHSKRRHPAVYINTAGTWMYMDHAILARKKCFCHQFSTIPNSVFGLNMSESAAEKPLQDAAKDAKAAVSDPFAIFLKVPATDQMGTCHAGKTWYVQN